MFRVGRYGGEFQRCSAQRRTAQRAGRRARTARGQGERRLRRCGLGARICALAQGAAWVLGALPASCYAADMATDGTVFDEARLLDKLRAIEALFAGASTDGERVAAAEARARIQLRLKEVEAADPPMEYKFSVADGWSAKLFMALCRRYGIKPYRYRGQRRTTLMARVSRRFVDETLWPEYEQLSAVLRRHLDEVTHRIITAAIHQDVSEAAETAPTGQLGPGSTGGR